MTATRPAPAQLEGRYIRISPLVRDDLPALFEAIGRPEVFAGGYGGGPAGLRSNAADFAAWAETYYLWGSSDVLAIRLAGGADDGTLVGTSTLGEYDLPNEAAHIGWTAWDPRVWGTAVNPEAKLLMLGHAFDSGIGRVKIQADARNDRSRAAIAKMGATFEGIVRRDRRRADGTWRDTAVFSVIVDDWPEVKAGLESRLDAFDGVPVTLRA